MPADEKRKMRFEKELHVLSKTHFLVRREFFLYDYRSARGTYERRSDTLLYAGRMIFPALISSSIR